MRARFFCTGHAFRLVSISLVFICGLSRSSGLLKFDASHNQLADGAGLQQLANCQILRLSHNALGPTLPDGWGDPVNGVCVEYSRTPFLTHRSGIQ